MQICKQSILDLQNNTGKEKYENGRKSRKNFFTLIGILGVMLLLLPQIGISVDSIMSGSMEPVLRTGGIVFTDTKERRPEIGDIVTYQVGETRVTHRVIRKEHKGYVTKGDANNRKIRRL